MPKAFTAPELERIVIGACLSGASLITDIIPHPLVFTDYNCRVTYMAIMSIARRSEELHMGSIVDWLQRNSRESVISDMKLIRDSEGVLHGSALVNSYILTDGDNSQDTAVSLIDGGFVWYSQLPNSTAGAETNAHRLVELYRQRKLVDRLRAVVTKSDLGLDEMLAGIDQACIDVAKSGSRCDVVQSVDVLEEYITTADEEDPFGYEMCFPQMTKDNVTLRGGDFHVIAADSGVGKTVMAVQIAHELAMQGKRIYYFTLEMGQRDMALRQFTYHTGLDTRTIHQHKQNHTLRKQLYAQWEEMKHCKMLLPDVKSMNIDNIVSSTKQLVARGEVDVLVADYIQSIRVDGCRGLYENVEAASAALKELALACNIPVIGLSQLNRDKDRQKREPCMADLKGASQIENDAQSIHFISINYDKWEHGSPTAPVIITRAKNRQGPVGSWGATRYNKKCRFSTEWHAI